MPRAINGRTVFNSPLQSGEPRFEIRGNDMLAVETVMAWMKMAVEYGVSGEVLKDAASIRDAMIEWRTQQGTKLPD